MRNQGLLRTLSVCALIAAPAAVHATSVATNQGVANSYVTQSAAPTAASQSATIIANNVTGALGGGGASGPSLTQTDYFNLRDQFGKSAAGDRPMRFNAWASAGYSGIDANDRGGEFDGRVINVVGGFDYKFTDRLLAGLTVGYENTDIDTTFNRGTFEGDGITVGPYIGFTLTRNWRFNALATYTWLDYDVRSGTAGTTGSFDASRVTGAANLSGDYRWNKWLFGPSAGVLWMRETQENYRDSAGNAVDGDDIYLGRVSFGGTIGYDFGRIRPYAKALGEYDFDHEAAVDLGNGRKASDDRAGAVVGGGVNVALIPNRLGAGIEGTYNTLGRENLDVYTVRGRLELKF